MFSFFSSQLQIYFRLGTSICIPCYLYFVQFINKSYFFNLSFFTSKLLNSLWYMASTGPSMYVCDSTVGGVLNTLRAGGAGLGNRRPNIHGSSTKWCPLCLNKGIVNRLSEHHVVVSCQAVAYERSATGLGALMVGRPQSSRATLMGILGGDNVSKEVLLKRTTKISLLLDRWMDLAGAT